MKKKMTAVLAAAYIASLMSFSAYAQAPAEDIADGAGNVVENVGEGAGDVIEGVGDGISDIADGIGDAASDVLDGAGNAVDEITGGDQTDDTAVGDTDPADGLADITDEDDVPDDDDVEDEIEAEDEDDDAGIYEAELNNTNKNDRNPATGGLPFMTAGLVSVAAAGVAYLTKKRNLENGQGQ